MQLPIKRTLDQARSRRGFTIVELLVVIVVIGILATLVVVSYGSWRKSTLTAQVKSDLNGVVSAMENARNFNNAYPVTLPTTIVASNGVSLSGGGSADGKSYCVDGASVEDPTITYYVDSSSGTGGAQQGTCATRPMLPSVPSGLAVVSTTGSQLNLSWTAAAGATGYTVQCALDTSFTVGIQQSTSATTTGSVTGLSGGLVYYCRVQATNATGSSGWSANITTTMTNTGVVTTLAGSGTAGSANGAGSAAQFSHPSGVAVDSSDTVYVADIVNNLIRKITAAGVVTTLAGSGTYGSANGTGTAAQFNYPQGVAVDSSGTVYVGDSNNELIRKITAAGLVTTLAGSIQGFADGTGTAAQFNYPQGVAVDSSGTVYVADKNNERIRKITAAGVVTTLAGSSTAGSANGAGSAAQFNAPYGVAVDSSGTVYVGDQGNNLIRKITAAGVVTTLAGSGTAGFADGTGSAAQFNHPSSVTVDSLGTVYVADFFNQRIRKITAAGVVTTLAGSGTAGFADGTGSAAQFSYPYGVAVDSSGKVYVGDYNNNRIRKIQ